MTIGYYYKEYEINGTKYFVSQYAENLISSSSGNTATFIQNSMSLSVAAYVPDRISKGYSGISFPDGYIMFYLLN